MKHTHTWKIKKSRMQMGSNEYKMNHFMMCDSCGISLETGWYEILNSNKQRLIVDDVEVTVSPLA